jgi:hypothetical protein
MSDPSNSIEVAVEQRLFGLFSATKALKDLSQVSAGRAVIARPKCVEELEIARDAISRILDKVGGK